MNKRMRKKKRLEREVEAVRSLYGNLLARMTLLEESQITLVRENAMLKDRLETFEKINEDNVLVAK